MEGWITKNNFSSLKGKHNKHLVSGNLMTRKTCSPLIMILHKMFSMLELEGRAIILTGHWCLKIMKYGFLQFKVRVISGYVLVTLEVLFLNVLI
jgi:hypothetical protein